KYSVSFDSRGGSAVAGVTVEHGEAVAKPTLDPVREGYEFTGWFVDAELTDAYDFAEPVVGDLVLHAKWEAETKPPVGPTEPQPPTEPGDEGETPGGGCPPGSGQKPGGVILPGEGPKPGGSNASAGGCTGAGIADSGAASPLATVAGGLLALLAGAALVLARRRDIA
nr:InlB B-repeat-containing protein [Leucobacter sp.]